MPKPVYLITAVARNRVIGKDGKLPWNIPEDSAFFLDSVKGGVVIEGRKGFEEHGGALPETDTIVLSRNYAFRAEGEGVLVASSLDLALELAQHSEQAGPIWICGGQAVYEEALPLADRLYLTLIDEVFEGDTYFPEWNQAFARVVEERVSQDAGYELRYMILER